MRIRADQGVNVERGLFQDGHHSLRDAAAGCH
jgi:hypothetical protein